MPRARKSKSPDDEPLFGNEDVTEDTDDKPKGKKRKRKAPAADAPAACQATGCRLPAAPDSDYCNVHTLVFDGMRRLRNSSRKSAAKGDFGKGALHGIGSVALDLLGQVFSNAGENVATTANERAEGLNWERVASAFGGFAPTGTNQPPTATPQQPDCWSILGLDPKTATAKDIREMQRKLAAIYHTDRGNPAIAAQKLAEINAACSTALLLLQ
jgi:hypothetical protein